MVPRIIRIGQMLLIIAMFSACGGHWMLLQSAAWAKMVADLSRHDNLATAVEKTFDGEHPCELCKKIKAGKAKEKQQETQVVVKKLEFYYRPSVITLARLDEVWVQRIQTCAIPQCANEPPTPPPRRAIA